MRASGRAMMRILSLALSLTRSAVWADDLLIPSLSIEEYSSKAIEEGIRGKQTALVMESAGYVREITFRQTDSPAMRLNYTNSRGETITNGSTAVSNAHQTTLSVDETTPLGTRLSAAGQWADSGGTLGPTETVARPGFTANASQPPYLFGT